MTTTVCAVVLGIILVVTIRPGDGTFKPASATKGTTTRPLVTTDTLLDLVRNLFPPNIIQATIFQYRTLLEKPENWTEQTPLTDWTIKHEYTQGTNVLGLVMFSIIMGVTIGKMREKGRALQEFFVALSDAMMIITSWVIWLSPLGVYFLVTSKILEIDSFAEMVGQLGKYFMTVMLGLFIHGFGLLIIEKILKLSCDKIIIFRNPGCIILRVRS